MKRTLWLAVLAAFILSLPAWGQEIRVTSPVAGARWCIGSSYTVTWTKSGTMDANVSIRLRLRGGGEEGVVTMSDRTENDGSFGPWTVPVGTTPGDYLVRIRTIDGAVTGSSDYIDVARCAEPSATITVTAPNGGESWELGNPRDITWSQSGVSGTVNIDLLHRGSVLGRIANGVTASSGRYSWTVGRYDGGTAEARGGYRVRVSHSSGTPSDDSNGDFSLTAPPGGASITVTAPGADIDWRPGSRHTIRWRKTGELNPMANITLRREGAPETEAAAVRIADGCANNGSRDWFIPDSLAEGRYFVRVKAGAIQGDSAVFAVSAEGWGTALGGPDTPFRVDLSMPGVGIEYYNGHVVAWVKNNGPDSLRDHDVTFRLHFPEREPSARIITKRITIPVGAEEGVQLLAMAAGDIPAAGLRTIVSVDAALSHIQDANRLNQHRDVRIFSDNRTPIDLALGISDQRVAHIVGGGDLREGIPHYKYRLHATLHLRNNSGAPTEIPRMACSWKEEYLTDAGWSHDPEVHAHGTLTLGPFRPGEDITHRIELEYRTYMFQNERRIRFVLDPDRLLNDPNRDNNEVASISYDIP